MSACRSCCIRGRAVTTTSESSTTMKYAIEVRPSTQRGRTAFAVDGDRVFVMSSSRSLPPLSGGPAGVTSGQAPDGHHGRGKFGRRLLSVHGDAVRLILGA